MQTKTVNLLSSRGYEYLAERLSALPPMENWSFRPVNLERKIFPDGETCCRIREVENIRNQPAVLICGTISDEAVFEAYNLASALVMEQCSSLHLVIPYFGYSTMERSTRDGEIVVAKNIARLLSSLPSSPRGNYIYMLDLHSLGTQYYFEGSVHPVHIAAEPLICEELCRRNDNPVLASADMGRAKWIQKMSGKLGLDSAFIMKKRTSGENTEIIALNAEVKGRPVVIYDDMIRSGSSILNAAAAYKSVGAKSVTLMTTHGVFTSGAVAEMRRSGLVDELICTDSHPKALTAAAEHPDFVRLKSVAALICRALQI